MNSAQGKEKSRIAAALWQAHAATENAIGVLYAAAVHMGVTRMERPPIAADVHMADCVARALTALMNTLGQLSEDLELAGKDEKHREAVIEKIDSLAARVWPEGGDQ